MSEDMSTNRMTARITTVIAVCALLLLGGVQGCAVSVNRQCEETRRAAIASSDGTARTIAMVRACGP